MKWGATRPRAALRAGCIHFLLTQTLNPQLSTIN